MGDDHEPNVDGAIDLLGVVVQQQSVSEARSSGPAGERRASAFGDAN